MYGTTTSQVNRDAYLEKYGLLGEKVLLAWNWVNPLHCYYGEYCNPDEYTGYCSRFIEQWNKRFIGFGNNPATLEELEEYVRRSFYTSQVVGEKWVSLKDIREIAQTILDQQP